LVNASLRFISPHCGLHILGRRRWGSCSFPFATFRHGQGPGASTSRKILETNHLRKDRSCENCKMFLKTLLVHNTDGNQQNCVFCLQSGEIQI
jgi:hypothetical protein